MLSNKSPEPMRVGAGSSASRLDDFWSRMAQLFSLGHMVYEAFRIYFDDRRIFHRCLVHEIMC